MVLEARALVVTQGLELHFFPARGPLLLIGPRAVFAYRGDAEIRSTAHSERSNRTCAWSQQASHRSLSPGGGLPPGIDFLTPSTLSNCSCLWYWYGSYYEQYVQFKYQYNYYCYILDPYIDTIYGVDSARIRKILFPSSPVPLRFYRLHTIEATRRHLLFRQYPL